MNDCKECGKTFDIKEYNICPYCGEVPEVETSGGEENLLPGSEKPYDQEKPAAEEEQLVKDKRPVDESENGKPVNRKKYIISGVFGLIIIGIVAFLLISNLNIGETGATVPDRYPTIQEAIDAAQDGDEIVIAAGVYRENIDFKGKNIVLRSTDPENPEIVDRTIIDGGGSGTVVSFRSGESEEAALVGLTITNGGGILISGGSSPLIENCVIENNDAEFGAGIAMFDASPTIINNSIIANTGFLGGGLFIEESSPLIEGNVIAMNEAEMGAGMVIISGSDPTIRNNLILDNTAARLGAGIVVASDSSPLIVENTITGNVAARNGGGILIEESEPLIEDNIINENAASNGGGIFIVNSFGGTLKISRNEISENIAFIAGAGIYMEGSSPLVEDNNILRNISQALGGGAAIYNSETVFLNNLFEDNEADGLEGGGAIWISTDSTLDVGEPDENIFSNNIPDDLLYE